VVQPQFDSESLSNGYVFGSESSSYISDTPKAIYSIDSVLDNVLTHDDELSQNNQEQVRSDSRAIHWTGQTGQGKKWNVHLGDAREVLSAFPDDIFECVITSPPYYWLRDYGVEGQIGKEWKVSEYVRVIADVMDQVRRVLASEGVLFLNIGDTYYSGKGESHGVDKKSRKRRFGLRAVDASGLGIPQKSLIGIPWRVAIEMIDRGWVLRSSIIWDRVHALPESAKDRPGRTYEYIFMFVKSRKYYFNQEALNGQKDDVWTVSARPKPTPGISTAPFPDELVQKCINVGCPLNGNVLDPFAGSGTTLRVALQEKRNATGIDLNPDFCDYMVKELMWS